MVARVQGFHHPHWMDCTEITIESVRLYWNYIYPQLNSGAHLEVEIQGTQCGGLSQIE